MPAERIDSHRLFQAIKLSPLGAVLKANLQPKAKKALVKALDQDANPVAAMSQLRASITPMVREKLHSIREQGDPSGALSPMAKKMMEDAPESAVDGAMFLLVDELLSDAYEEAIAITGR